MTAGAISFQAVPRSVCFGLALALVLSAGPARAATVAWWPCEEGPLNPAAPGTAGALLDSSGLPPGAP